ncbi:MAG: rod shape-determining protein MreD [Lachnospiraceae bacterium]|jgi:rod shape-determining protein MreD|nr:rod shape-determining protein MreD [Lachnospiraceae bacterium]NBJ81192.1 rod shape-determining protein MreD [bacterium 1XD42-76]NBK04635.1 rod shape-determining protein MreD [bacterium 1XD42-94]
MNRNSIKQICINLFLIVLAFTVQTCVFPLIPVLSAGPNLMLILVFSFGFIRGSRSGIGYGLVGGLLTDLSSGGALGFHTLIFMWIGYVNGIATKYYYEDYITLPLVLCVLNELAYNLYLYVFGFLVRGRLNFGYYLVNIILPETIFTVVTTLLLYRLFLFISRKLEEIEKRRDTTIV